MVAGAAMHKGAGPPAPMSSCPSVSGRPKCPQQADSCCCPSSFRAVASGHTLQGGTGGWGAIFAIQKRDMGYVASQLRDKGHQQLGDSSDKGAPPTTLQKPRPAPTGLSGPSCTLTTAPLAVRVPLALVSDPVLLLQSLVSPATTCSGCQRPAPTTRPRGQRCHL